MRHILSLLVCIFMTVLFQPLSAADNQKFPDSLFGVKLGGVYNLGSGNDSKDVGNIPVKKFTGMQQFLGSGLHYYFEPLKDYKAFRYVERRENPDDEYFTTSFSAYILPIIPEKTKSLDGLEKMVVNWEVISIVWTDILDKNGNKKDEYFWAVDLCKTVGADLGREPEIADFEGRWYSCSFKEGLKHLRIEGIPGLKTFSLKYMDTESKRKQEAVEVLRRKLQMKEIKPY